MRPENFEISFAKAQTIISSIDGYISHELRKCVEKPNRYILLVNWETIEAHTIEFRKSDEYQQWRKLPHHFYAPFPKVEHYNKVM